MARPAAAERLASAQAGRRSERRLARPACDRFGCRNGRQLQPHGGRAAGRAQLGADGGSRPAAPAGHRPRRPAITGRGGLPSTAISARPLSRRGRLRRHHADQLEARVGRRLGCRASADAVRVLPSRRDRSPPPPTRRHWRSRCAAALASERDQQPRQPEHGAGGHQGPDHEGQQAHRHRAIIMQPTSTDRVCTR